MPPFPRLFRTASFRFAALYVLLFVVSSAILGVAVFLTARGSLQQQLTASVQSDAAFLQAEYQRGGLPHLEALIAARQREPDAPDYLLQGPAGQHLAGEIEMTARLRPGWMVLQTQEAGLDLERPERLRTLVVDLGGGLRLAVGDDLARIGEVEEAIASAFAWVVGLAVVLGIGGGVVLSRTFLTRVDTIGRTAEAIIAGDLTRRIPVHGDDDFDRLSATLNHMLDRISGLMETLRQLSSDIAHDLRTPLSRLYQKLENMREGPRTPQEQTEAVEAALRDANALMETFSALLRIAQVEGASRRASFRALDLSAVLDAVIDAYRPDAEDEGHLILAEIKPAIQISGDKELLTQAIANLLENALRHTPRGTVVRIRLAAPTGQDIRLTVEDDGPGVTAADLPHLAERFYRADRSRTTPGNGLGLSLVSAVAELHAARLCFQRLSPGFRAILLFPVHVAP